MTRPILLFDDDPGEGALVRYHLDRIPGFSYELHHAPTPEAGLLELAELDPRVVMIADRLQSVSAVDIVARARAAGCVRPIIILGSKDDAQLAVRIVQAGADEYVRKSHMDPLSLHESIERAETRSVRRRVRRELEDQALHLSGMLERESLALRELEMAMERAESASRTKSEFLANVSHEIRTPLTAILGYASELRNLDLPDEERAEAAEVIEQNGHYLLQVVNNILDLSSMEAGELPLRSELFEPAQIVAEVCRTLTPVAQKADLQLSWQVEDSVPKDAYSDPIRVKQILMNLVGNAVKFTQQGSIEVLLRLRAEDDARSPEERTLEISVRDTGIGMTVEQIGRVFRPFTQADTGTARRFGGTGLGLTICEGLARRLGGIIDVQSQPNGGSTFRLDLPVGRPPHTIPTRESRADGDSPLRGHHVLVADDTAVNLRLIHRLLERGGATVDAVPNGQAVLDLYRTGSEKYAAIILDLQMPRLDGFATFKRLREEGWAGPTIALTGNAFEEERQRCLDSGFDAFLTKPVDREQLCNAINDLVAQAASRSKEKVTEAPKP